MPMFGMSALALVVYGKRLMLVLRGPPFLMIRKCMPLVLSRLTHQTLIPFGSELVRMLADAILALVMASIVAKMVGKLGRIWG